MTPRAHPAAVSVIATLAIACHLVATTSAGTVATSGYCELMPEAGEATVTISPNQSGTCLWPFGPGTDISCEADQQILVDVEWATPIADTTPFLRCIVGNPEQSSEDDVRLGCVTAAPASCLSAIGHLELFSGDTPVPTDPGPLRCGYETTGASHPHRAATFVDDTDASQPGTQPGLVPNEIYCEGLSRSEGDPEYPWAAGLCCRQQFDVVFSVDPPQPLTRVRFVATTHLAVIGQPDFRFERPRCGDGIRYCHEQCDDGNSENLDTCSDDCEISDWACGQPTDGNRSGPSVSDALVVLRTASSLQTCGCLCDVDDSADVTATDALLVLRAATGQSVALTCDRCPRGGEAPDGRTEPHQFQHPGLQPLCDLGVGFEPIFDFDLEETLCEQSRRCTICNQNDLLLLHPTLEECEATLESAR